MNVADLMQTDVATVRPTDTLAAAAALLRTRDCGCVVVIDAQRRPVGVLTDRDVCLAAERSDRALTALDVAASMSPRPFVCRRADPVAAAELAMELHQVRRLPVVDADGRLVGVLALDDIAREACREADLMAPPVSCAAVGRTLGLIARPRLLDDRGATVRA